MSYYELGKTFQSPLYANLLQEAMLKQQQQAAEQQQMMQEAQAVGSAAPMVKAVQQ